MATKSHARLAAWAAAAILVVIAGFQFYWGFGGTWGAHEASGGAMDELTTSEQIASVIGGLVLLALAGIVLIRVGYWRDHVPFAIARIGTWVIAVLLLLGALVNFTAQTDFERFVNGPVALLVALLTFVVARSEVPVSPTGRSEPRTPKRGAPTPVH
ncbi:MAG TPA: DUF3995 domain-containing protein [Vicinamibacterales bacterium]|nr:DUF3995 domain-containing protein [Vicinamibacterales bacterium]